MSIFVRSSTRKIETLTCNQWLIRRRGKHDNPKIDNRTSNSKESKFSSPNVKSSINEYALSKFSKYVSGFADVLEKKFPAAMKVYRIFTVGTKDFVQDFKEYYKINRRVSYSGLKILRRKELELYFTMPRNIIQLTPVILFTPVPFSNYLVFPLALMFPKYLLTSHYWSLQQRAKFALEDHKQRLQNFEPVFNCLQGRTSELDCDERLKKTWLSVLGDIGSGLQPPVQELIQCSILFSKPPYHLKNLKSSHLKHLLKVHNMHSGWRKRARLARRAEIIQLMDAAIKKEGGAENLTFDELKWACFLRGLNPVNVKNEELVQWLNQWVQLSEKVDEKTYSLLLHYPILLAYNHPSNWFLLKS
nr:PREDICTED: LETM1 domain-containing protein 1 isoform X1 [Bemisia tabaci]